MATLDEITKEKQRLGEALTRVDAQREKLVSQLSELETVERVLARHSKGRQPRKTSSVKMPTTVAKTAAPARLRGRRRSAIAKSAGGSRNSPSLSDQVLALATGKTQQEITAACVPCATRRFDRQRNPKIGGSHKRPSAVRGRSPRIEAPGVGSVPAAPAPAALGREF
jgi:hypothetical protein